MFLIRFQWDDVSFFFQKCSNFDENSAFNGRFIQNDEKVGDVLGNETADLAGLNRAMLTATCQQTNTLLAGNNAII